jgi:hypothetical protein
VLNTREEIKAWLADVYARDMRPIRSGIAWWTTPAPPTPRPAATRTAPTCCAPP